MQYVLLGDSSALGLSRTIVPPPTRVMALATGVEVLLFSSNCTLFRFAAVPSFSVRMPYTSRMPSCDRAVLIRQLSGCLETMREP
jgi:hypothetical protein